jgi:hypothetical protein
VLPTQSVCLQVPVVFPSEFGESFVQRRMDEARRRRAGPSTEPQDPQPA